MRALPALLVLVFVVAVYLGVAVHASRTQKPVRAAIPLGNVPPGLAPAVGEVLTVATWNLGYAGLGADADFIADGGRRVFPPSWASPRRNLARILALTRGLDVDLALYQEVADASPLSYWVPLDAQLRAANSDRLYLFQHDIATRLLPWPLRVRHGLVAISRIRPVVAESIPLPLEPVPTMGLVNRLYALQTMRFAEACGGPGWTIFNLHLSAFDDGEVRLAQLDAALAAAAAEHVQGRRVVLGGDWNLALVGRTGADPALFWLRDFPHERLAEGWTVVAPADRPTVRTNHKPYVAGDNPTATIDGFIVSPNVRVLSVEALETGFNMSDHQPVIARFAAR